jgi:ABC-2 type transport system ATP-binding protein
MGKSNASVGRSTVICTQGLGKTYNPGRASTEVAALRSLDLKVPGNSIFGFLGPNGAGKTTAIKLLLGLARPTRGSGSVFGHDIVRDSLEIRRRVGYLTQDPRFYDHMTARETLRFRARFFYSGPRAGIEARVSGALELVGLADKADRPIRGFSGGERQRLGIAQAQVNHPDLLILDEPAANLDPLGRRDVLKVMERLRDAQGITIFYSTHILDDVQQVSDAVAILDHGELVAQGPLEELLAGSEGTVYSLAIEGDASAAQSRVSSQDWVSGINVTKVNGRVSWQVTVTDEEAARTQLLRLVLADGRADVVEFGRKQFELEEIFVSMVEGTQAEGTAASIAKGGRYVRA